MADITPVTYHRKPTYRCVRAAECRCCAALVPEKAELLVSIISQSHRCAEFYKIVSVTNNPHWQFNLHILQQHYADHLVVAVLHHSIFRPVLFIKNGASRLRAEHQPAIAQHSPMPV